MRRKVGRDEERLTLRILPVEQFRTMPLRNVGVGRTFPLKDD